MGGYGGTLHLELRAGARAAGPGLEQVVGELESALGSAFPPCFDLTLVDREGVLLRAYGGHACLDPLTPSGPETRFDLASLTKVVATTTVVLRLREEGLLGLDDPVARHLRGFPRDDLLVEHLLTHSSGLLAHRPYFLLEGGRRAFRRALYDDVRAGGPTGPVLYSDLNFIVLGWMVESLTGRRLDATVRDLVTTPLQMSATGYRPRVAERRNSAATELDGDQRTTPGLVWGEVHDGNAFALGGVAGHAGLFAPAADLARFAAALLSPGSGTVLGPESVDELGRRRAGADLDVRSLGWRLEPVAWGEWPDGTFWHTGFTGTSLLVSPRAGLGVVLLTNAVHPVRQLDRQEAFRAALHRSILAWRS